MYYLVDFYDENGKIEDVVYFPELDPALTCLVTFVVLGKTKHFKVFMASDKGFKWLIWEYDIIGGGKNGSCK